MKLSNNSIAFMLVGIVVLAGCVGQPPGGGAGTGGTAGIVISALQVSPPQVYGGGIAVISANVKNLGQATPNKVTAEIFGLEAWMAQSGTTKQVVNLASALPRADPTLGQQGGETIAVWSYQAPQKEAVVSYPIIVRVSYDYQTIFNGVMRAVEANYFRQTNQQGGIVSQSFTSGPLSIAVKVPTVISRSASVPVQFEITNIGGGRVCKKDSDCTLGNLDTLAYTVPTGMKCGALNTGTTVLGGGTKTILSCTVDANAVTTVANIDLKLTLDYTYFVDAAQTVTILPIVGTVVTGTTTTPTPIPTDVRIAVQSLTAQSQGFPPQVGKEGTEMILDAFFVNRGTSSINTPNVIKFKVATADITECPTNIEIGGKDTVAKVSCTWKPKQAGTYDVTVEVSDSRYADPFDNKKIVQVTIQPK